MYHQKKTRAHKKRKKHQGTAATETAIGGKQVKKVKTRGGSPKTKLVKDEYANVLINGKSVKAKITGVSENPTSKDYTRRNVITKGAIIKVEAGTKKLEAKVTSRPGQDGVVNAVSL